MQMLARYAATPFLRLLWAVLLVPGLVATSHAAPITGDPQGNTYGWIPNSTNALNYAMQAPGRVGQTAPHVLFNSNAVGEVTLDFFNFASGLAFFEVRLDGNVTGATPHPVVIGDLIHTGGVGVASQTSQSRTFFASQYVDIRLALGAERDWDFDWVRFEAVPETAAVPEPGTLGLLGLGLLGLVRARRRQM